MKDIGLKPSVKYSLLNGGLECTLNEYVMFSGGYNDFRAEGGVVKHASEKTEAPKIKRMSDREWEDAASKFDGKSRKKDFGKGDKPRRHDDKPRRFDKEKTRQFDNDGFRGFDSDKPRRFDSDKPRRFDSDKPRRFDGNKPGFSQPRNISDRGPRLTEYTEMRAPGKMRSRKNSRRFNDSDDSE